MSAREHPRAERIRAALGQVPCDLVLHDAQLVNVFTREVLPGSVAIWRDRIVGVGEIAPGAIGPGTEVRDLKGAFLLPGFIDPHMHAGDTSLPIQALAAALLERGTTGLATDMCELYAVGGVPAVRWGIEVAEEAGLRVLFMLPLHSLGAERFGAFAHPPTIEEYMEMASWPQTIAVNEPPPNVVLRGHEGVLSVIDRVMGDGRRFEGHAPGLTGTDLQAYIAAGSSSDHEAVGAEEALEKLRLGYRIIMRECGASRDLRELVKVVVERPETARFFMVGSDDMQAKEFVNEGHIDHKLRQVMAAGIDPLTAIQMATINVAEYFGLADDLGSISPGKRADLQWLGSLTELRSPTVIAAGRVVVEGGRFLGDRSRAREVPEYLRSRVNLGRDIGPAGFRVPAPVDDGLVRVRVMGINDGSLISDPREHVLTARDGELLADPAADVLKIAVLDRHNASGAIGLGFVQGFGLQAGAIATTFFWQHFSLLVVGTSDAELASAVAHMRELGGGVLAVRDGELLHGVPLPVGGIVGSGTLEEIHADLQGFERATAELGCPLHDPFMSLAFASIPHIPHYGITDKGWYDTFAEGFVDIVLG
ncbi:MAG TPA: adenine deaminase C-terminal domain-containing protein [Solirubrobacteraceae bacterium]|jgi:adenine deaminase|nr:adenine deaminase C-terminal domain-containing protein [Solirubrobacteraceae bacterium]